MSPHMNIKQYVILIETENNNEPFLGPNCDCKHESIWIVPFIIWQPVSSSNIITVSDVKDMLFSIMEPFAVVETK